MQLNIDAIPRQLSSRQQWVAWNNVDGRKIPCQVSGAPASSTAPDTWTNFNAVIKAFESGRYGGIGYVITNNDPLIGVDIDHCLLPDGTLTPEAEKIVQALDSYTEISPSGDGLHIWIEGDKSALHKACLKTPGLEIYTTSRYFTVIGNVYGPPRPIRQNATETINKIIAQHVPPPPESATLPTQLVGSPQGSSTSYGQAALRSELAKLSSTPEGMRNTELNKSAFKLGHLVAGGELNHGQVVTALLSTALSIGLPENEARKTIKSGMDSGSREPRTATARTKGAPKDQNVWGEPEPLITKVEALPYPLDALPERIGAAVEEVQGFVKAPVALVASSALGAVSLATQAHIDVERAARLDGPSSLFLLTIADSGERKSTCDNFFLTSIRNHEVEQSEFAKPEIQAYAAERAAWEAKVAGMKDGIKQATKNGKGTGDLEFELRVLHKEEPAQPKVPRLLLGDETPENLAWKMGREWPSGGVISAEGGAILGAHGMGPDSLMRNLALLNILWDGGTLVIGRRKEGGSFTVQGARLTVHLQIQAATLRAFFDRSGGLARGTGFLARFLISLPESTQGHRPYTEPPDRWPALASFHSRIAEILNIPVPVDEDGRLTPTMLTMTQEAKACWIAFHDAIESGLRIGGELCDVRDVASKTADNAARLAALFHTFEHGTGGAIGAEHIESAARIVTWSLNESRRFFSELAMPEELTNVSKLDDWLRNYCHQNKKIEVSARQVQQYGPGPLRDKTKLEDALRELEDLGRARLVKVGRQKVIHINPTLLEGGAS